MNSISLQAAAAMVVISAGALCLTRRHWKAAGWHGPFVVPTSGNRWHLLAVLALVLGATGAVHAQSVSLTTPASGQSFTNKNSSVYSQSAVWVDFAGQLTTAVAGCRTVSLYLNLDGTGEFVEGVYGSGSQPWKARHPISIGSHTIQARMVVYDDPKRGCSGARTEKKSSQVAFSVSAVPDIAITSLTPGNGSTATGHGITLASNIGFAFGSNPPGGVMTASLYLDSNLVLSRTEATSSLHLETPVSLNSGQHTVRVDAKLVNSTTNQSLDTDSKQSTFTVFAPDSCDGGVCEISDKNSSIVTAGFSAPGIIDDGFGFKQKTPGGLLQWQVDGRNMMFSRWHWFRLAGATSEMAVGSTEHFDAGAENTVFTQDDATNQIVLKYSGATFPVDMDIQYTLLGGEPGSFTSTLAYQATLTNRTAAPLDMEWFDYNDLDMTEGGTADRFMPAGTTWGTVRQATCPLTQRGLLATDEGTAPPDQFVLDLFTGRLAANGGRKNVLDELLDRLPTRLDTLASQPEGIVEDRIYAKQQHLHLLPNQKTVVKGTIRITAPFTAGDLNCDGTVDPADLGVITSALNTPAIGPNDPRDLDHDGRITVLDARKLVLLCGAKCLKP